MPSGTRRRFLAVSAAAASTVLGACARPSPEPIPSPAPQPVALSYWKSLSGPRHDAQVRLVETFNATQSGARVSLEHQGEYAQLSEKLRLALASGTPPDAAMLGTNTDLPAFARLGVLQPLDSFAIKDPTLRLEDFSPGFIRDSRIPLPATGGVDRHLAGGALYQLPFARSVPLLFANADRLHGPTGAPETLPTTWPTFLDTAQRLVRARRSGVTEDPLAPSAEAGPFAFGLGNSWWEFQATLWSFGGAFSDAGKRVLADAPASIEAVRFLSDLVHRHRVALATKNAQGAFLRGDTDLLITSSANLTQIEEGAPFRVVAGPLPGAAGSGVPGGGAGLSLLSGLPQRHREQGWRFLAFMTDLESTARFARETGYAPVRPGAYSHPLLTEALERSPNARLALVQADRVRPVDAVLSAPGAAQAVQEMLETVLFGGAAVADACARLAVQLRRAAEAA